MAKRKRRKQMVAQAVPTIEVRNPSYQPGHPTEIERVTVQRSMRNDVLGRLHVARRIDDCCYAAGREMQKLLEAAEVRGPRSVDLTQDPVDGGGRICSIMTDRQLAAIKKLNALWPILGKQGETIIRAVLMFGMMPEEFARYSLGHIDRMEINSIGREFRRHLETLAVEFGLSRRQAS